MRANISPNWEKFMRTESLLLLCLSLSSVSVPAADEDSLVGITWEDSVVVSFSPRNGAILEEHLQLDPYEAFRGLAHDQAHHKLYALAQSTHNLYTIDTNTLEIAHVGNLRVDARKSRYYDVGALAYDSSTATLYTAIERWENWDYTGIWSELCKIDPSNAALTTVGRIDGPFIDSLAFNGTDRYLYALGIFGSGPWDDPDKAFVMRIDPNSADMTEIFQTPYHTMMGMAFRDSTNFYSWINWTSHLYGVTDIRTHETLQLADSDPVGVISAMIHRDFKLPTQNLKAEPLPASFRFFGHVTSIWDPGGLLTGRVEANQPLSGQFNYDITAPYKYPDPNYGGPYTLSVSINGIELSSHFLRASVLNNYYSSWGDSLSDGFQLLASDSDRFYDRLYDVSWMLTDPSATALTNNTTLPASFNLAQWERNIFVVSYYGGGYSNPGYYITGTIDFITPIQEFLNPEITNPAAAREREVLQGVPARGHVRAPAQ
jgi:hypothetical protein